MSEERMKGTLTGIGMSLIAVVIWIILGYIGIIAGVAGALMGVFFMIGYNKFNSENKTKYPYIIACILILIEIIIAELLTIAVICADLGVAMGEVLEIEEVKTAIITDIVIGLILSYVVFAVYIFTSKNKNKNQLERNTVITNIDGDADADMFKNEGGPKQL